MSTMTPINTSRDQLDEIDIKAWFFRMLRLWPWLVGFMVISLSMAWLYLSNAAPVFQSEAVLIIKDEKKTGSVSMNDELMKALNVSGSGKLMENEIEILKSKDLLESVIVQRQLFVSVWKDKYFADQALYGPSQPFELMVEDPAKVRQSTEWILQHRGNAWTLTETATGRVSGINMGQWFQIQGTRMILNHNLKSNGKVKLGQDQDNTYRILIQNPRSVALGYKKNLEVKPVGKQSTVISITVKDLCYDRGVAFLQSLLELYNTQGLEDKNQITSNTIDFLDERLRVVERDLQQVEASVENFKRVNKLSNLSEQSRVLLETVQNIDQEKAQRQSELNVIMALEKQLVTNQENPGMVPNTLGIADVSAASLIEKHNQLLLQRDRMTNMAGTQNPLYRDLTMQVKTVRQDLLENVRNLRKAYEIQLADVIIRDRRLATTLNNLPAMEKQLLEISRDRNVKEQIYLFLLQKREENAIALASSVKDTRTIELPHASSKTYPLVLPTYGISIVLGFFLAIIPMILIDFFDDRIGSAKEIGAKCLAPLLGEINYLKHLTYPIQIGENSRTVIAEQIRAIRTNLNFTELGSELKTILVSSHIPGEGKSFTCLNIAASYAILQKKVVVLEFDLRKPRVLKSLGLNSKTGISNVLTGNAALSEAVMEVEGFEGNLCVLPSGPIPPNPAELILGKYMEPLMEQLRAEYDVVIIDSPPFSLVTEALLLKNYTDATIIILRQGYSKKDALKQINEKFLHDPTKKVYTILNGVNRTSRYSYYSAKYSDGYSDQYGYGYNSYRTYEYVDKV
jgi:tyrosine-protein kinase Etk/Wzc